MKYTEEIFNKLSRGEFISANSTSVQVRRLYDAIDDNLQEYQDYFHGIGMQLEGGDGYYYFCRQEAKVDMTRKLEAMYKWIDYIDFLKTFNSTFGSGFEFRPADMLVRMSNDIELKEKAEGLFKEKKSHEEIVDKLIKEMENIGFVEISNEIDSTYKVTSAFHYIEEIVDCLTISEEVKDEIPE